MGPGCAAYGAGVQGTHLPGLPWTEGFLGGSTFSAQTGKVLGKAGQVVTLAEVRIISLTRRGWSCQRPSARDLLTDGQGQVLRVDAPSPHSALLAIPQSSGAEGSTSRGLGVHSPFSFGTHSFPPGMSSES